MLKISSVKYVRDEISVSLDSGEVLKIPYNISSVYTLETGRSISTEEYRQLKSESQRFVCKRKALDYLAIRIRSRQEMERYLSKKGFDKEIIAEIINGLKEKGYIDDYDYACTYIKDRLNRKVIGKNLIISELSKRGIPKKTIHRALKKLNADKVDTESVYELALKKYNTLKNKKNALNRLSFFLHQRGFDYSLVSEIIERIQMNEDQLD